MTEEERQKIKAGLIELGLWGADEPGDPTADVHDAGTLNDRLQARLTKSAFLVSERASDRSWTRVVVIFHEDQTYKLVSAPTYIEAISLAALALPEFLRRHPDAAINGEHKKVGGVLVSAQDGSLDTISGRAPPSLR